MSPDRLYELLPVIYRQRDIEMGYPLRELLRVVAEQVDQVENDIAQLYENWFIETCDDWVVPYIGDLLGHQPAVNELGVTASDGAPTHKVLSARREVANAIRFKRRKGSLWLLEQLSEAVAGWPSRAVEFGRRVAQAQSIVHLHGRRAGTVDLRSERRLDRIVTPFNSISHTADVRPIGSDRALGAYNVHNVAVYVWRLPVHPATKAVAHCFEEAGDHCYTISSLGHDIPLYHRPVADPEPEDIADEVNLPVPIRRETLAERTGGAGRTGVSETYYGEGRSLAIWANNWADLDLSKPVPADRIIAADLSDWEYRPPKDFLAVDPELGRIVFPPSQLPEEGVTVTYHYAFGMNIGGGEYERDLDYVPDVRVYRVGAALPLKTIAAALERWRDEKPLRTEKPRQTVIELGDNGVYKEPIDVELDDKESLEIRAKIGTRPVIDLLDWRTSRSDAMSITGGTGSSFTLDGILLAGRDVEIRGPLDELVIRHCTLVPGWSLHPDMKPRRPSEPSLAISSTTARIRIERSIIGSIHVSQDDPSADPLVLTITDSIVDATDLESPVISTPDSTIAPVVLVASRSTFLGCVHANAIELADNCIFAGQVQSARRQYGCMRYCYVPPASRTPPRFCCQPDLAEASLRESEASQGLSSSELQTLQQAEQLRLQPQFASMRYGEPAYGRLSLSCAEEIKRGADDRSELGVFHDLFEAQRIDRLRSRLADYVPAGTDVGLVFAS
jgi:hypothetical protein